MIDKVQKNTLTEHRSSVSQQRRKEVTEVWRKEVTEVWRKLYNEHLHNLRFSSNNVTVTKSVKME
jgi:hypothetical protein